MLWPLLGAPLAWLGWQVWQEYLVPNSALGADPTEAVLHYLGEWALIMLLLSYSVSPLRRLLRWPTLGQARRLVGLFAFSYVCVHLVIFVVFYVEFSITQLLVELAERPYITVGFAAWLALLLMAVTSTRGWQRRLGLNWRRLHRLGAVALALALVHLWWLTRATAGSTFDVIPLFVYDLFRSRVC